MQALPGRTLFLPAWCVLFLSTATAPAAAQGQGEPMVVAARWLADSLKDPRLVVLHVGDRADYDAGHIPGARFIDLQEVSSPRGEGLTLQLPSPGQLQSAFESKGISDSSRIILYVAGERLTAASRVYFSLDYLGFGRQTSILDGGLRAWKQEGRPVTPEAPEVTPGTLHPKLRPEVVATVSWLSSNLENPVLVLVDARTAEFYQGTSAGRMPRAGHIPGAVNIPYTVLTDETGRFRSREALRAVFANAGVRPGTQLVAYCHIGLQASLLYFAARYLDYEARLFDGSFEEWSARPDLPVATVPPPDRH